MRHNAGVQARLRERYRQLYKSDFDSFSDNVRYFLVWAEGNASIAALFGAIRRSVPDLEPATWLENDVNRHRGTNWPTTEDGRSKAILYTLERIAESGEGSHIPLGFCNARNFNEAIRLFNDRVVEPFIDYLDERLADETDLLFSLERYRRRVLWFEQERLWSLYEANKGKGEEVYDTDLRQFLFEQGVDYPFSQVESPSGRVDITVADDMDSPLAIEVKLFDGRNYGRSYLAKGVGQACRYAEDYDRPDAYLVVFNLSNRTLELPSDDVGRDWPPRLHVGERTVSLIVVQAAPRETASNAGRPELYPVTREQLVG